MRSAAAAPLGTPLSPFPPWYDAPALHASPSSPYSLNTPLSRGPAQLSVEQPPALPGRFAAGGPAYCTADNGIRVDGGRRRIQYGNEVTVVGPSENGNLRTTHVRVLFGTGVLRGDDVPISQVWSAACMESALTLP